MTTDDDTREPTDLKDCEELLEANKQKIESIKMQLMRGKGVANRGTTAWHEWKNRTLFALAKTERRRKELKDKRGQLIGAFRLTAGHLGHNDTLAALFRSATDVKRLVHSLMDEVKQLSGENAGLRKRLEAYETQQNYDPPTVAGHDFWRDGSELVHGGSTNGN